MSQRTPITAVLLTGGRSRRMGQDKAFLDFEGRPLWRHQVEMLAELRPSVIRISARPGQRFEDLPAGVTVQCDETDAGGALPALLPIFSRSAEPLLVVPVDTPYLDAEFLARAFPLSSGPGRIYRSQGRIQPLPALLPTTCASVAEEFAAAGELSLQAFCRTCAERGLLEIHELADEEAFRYANLNRPEDLPTPIDPGSRLE